MTSSTSMRGGKEGGGWVDMPAPAPQPVRARRSRAGGVHPRRLWAVDVAVACGQFVCSRRAAQWRPRCPTCTPRSEADAAVPARTVRQVPTPTMIAQPAAQHERHGAFAGREGGTATTPHGTALPPREMGNLVATRRETTESWRRANSSTCRACVLHGHESDGSREALTRSKRGSVAG